MTHTDWTERYSRPILLAGIGGEGQQRIMAASVGIFGDGPISLMLLDILARSGIGHLGLAIDSGSAESLARSSLLATQVSKSNRHARLNITPIIPDTPSLKHWASDFTAIVDASDCATIRSTLGHFCLGTGIFFHSCWASGDFGWLLAIDPSHPHTSKTNACPAISHETDTQTGEHPWHRLLPGLIASVAAGNILCKILRFKRKNSSSLLRIDARKGDFAEQPTAVCHCPMEATDNRDCSTSTISTESTIADDFIDITNDSCPMTFVRVKLRMETLPVGAILKIFLAGSEPVANVPMTLRNSGHRILAINEYKAHCELLVEKMV